MIYLIERPHKGLCSVSTLLMGNFALQCFASFQSFFSLIPPGENPMRVVIVGSDFKYDEMKGEVQKIQKTFKNALIVLISDHESKRVWVSSKLLVFPEAEVDQIMFQLDGLKTNTEKPLLNYNAQQFDRCSEGFVNIGDCLFDLEGLRLYSANDPSEYLDLTAKESRILNLLIRSANAVVSRDFMRETVWPDAAVSSRTIDSHISRLRKRLSDFGMSIDCQYGRGYQLSTDFRFE